MYSFLLGIGPLARTARLRTALERLESRVPGLGAPPSWEHQHWAELGLAWVAVRPASDFQRSLIQHHTSEELLVFTWGELTTHDGNCAELVAQVFLRGGVEAVSQLDGSFSAVLFERRHRSLHLCSDLFGQRALSYTSVGRGEDSTWWFSPHDLALVAVRGQAPSLDRTSVLSVAQCDWSFGGRSLDSRIERHDPFVHLSLSRGEPRRQTAAPLVHSQRRVHPRDRRARSGAVDAVAAAFERSASVLVQGQPELRTALTAGIDSRVVLSVLHGMRAPGQPLRAFTRGHADSLDARVALALSQCIGIPHTVLPPVPLAADDFLANTLTFAFYHNGQANAKRAFSSAPRVDPNAPWVAGGEGGEILRGFFYPYVSPLGTIPESTKALTSRLLKRRFRRLTVSDWGEPEVRLAVEGRLHEALERCWTWGETGADVLDLFYLRERFGIWGARLGAPWNRTWSPFSSTDAVRAAFQLPSPVATYCEVHRKLIQRHLPRTAYLMPVNGVHPLPLERGGPAAALLRSGIRAAVGATKVLRERIFSPTDASPTTEGPTAGQQLATQLFPAVEGLLNREGSATWELFGVAGANRLLAEHRSTQRHLQVLGFLLTIEQWLGLARQVGRPFLSTEE